jgi:hypothetical protein
VKVRHDEGGSEPHRPRAVRCRSQGRRRSVPPSMELGRLNFAGLLSGYGFLRGLYDRLRSCNFVFKRANCVPQQGDRSLPAFRKILAGFASLGLVSCWSTNGTHAGAGGVEGLQLAVENVLGEPEQLGRRAELRNVGEIVLAVAHLINAPLILPMSVRMSRFITVGTRFTGAVYGGGTASSAPPGNLFTLRRRPAW